MSRYVSARSRLTLLYTALFTLGGTALVLITYLLVANTLHPTATPRTSTRKAPARPMRSRVERTTER